MVMRDTESKPLFVEILYMLGLIVAAVAAAFIQFIGRHYEGDYSSFLFGGSVYRYNHISYVIGLVLFLLAIILTYIFLYRKKLDGAGDILKKRRGLYIFITILFSILMFAALFMVCFLMMGISVQMKPEWMLNATVFVWPSAVLVFMILTGILSGRKSE